MENNERYRRRLDENVQGVSFEDINKLLKKEFAKLPIKITSSDDFVKFTIQNAKDKYGYDFDASLKLSTSFKKNQERVVLLTGYYTASKDHYVKYNDSKVKVSFKDIGWEEGLSLPRIAPIKVKWLINYFKEFFE